MEGFVTILVRTLEWMFLVGIIGSALVILLSFVEDIETMFERDVPEEE